MKIYIIKDSIVDFCLVENEEYKRRESVVVISCSKDKMIKMSELSLK